MRAPRRCVRRRTRRRGRNTSRHFDMTAITAIFAPDKQTRTMKTFALIVLLSVISIAAISQKRKVKGFVSQDNAGFAQTISDKTIRLLDVRTPAEFAERHIPDACNIDVLDENFDSRIDSLDRDRPVAVYCRSGARSKKAAEKLAAKGFEVFELNSGFMHWDGAKEK